MTNMTPEDLWQFKEVRPLGLSKDEQSLFYEVKTPDIEKNTFDTRTFKIDFSDKKTREVTKRELKEQLADRKVSPNGNFELFHKKVHLKNIQAKDVYEDLPQTEAYVIDSLDYKHWDKFRDGSYNHLFIRNLQTQEEYNLMPNEPYHTPQSPFGGEEDYCWDAKGENIYYVSKKVSGTAYTTSTDTNIYKYNLSSGKTENITAPNPGYDTQPVCSKDGILAWLEMKTPGYESDKNELLILKEGEKINLTKDWDGTVFSFLWNNEGTGLYFVAPIGGTLQVFKVNLPTQNGSSEVIQITRGEFDVKSIIAQKEESLLLLREDMNHAAEVFIYDLKKENFEQLTSENKAAELEIKECSITHEFIPTSDGHSMFTWIIYPPDFDPDKKYPTLLYCQGGPQSPLSQFFSRRWNFKLIASQGYIVLAPNRRGMPGHGVEWNSRISGHWGEAMQDYLDAVDHLVKEPYVDADRLGAIGASFGGYSVFWLAGHHEGRFKTFIAHDGVFDTRSTYGTTEEVFFPNHDLGGAYWEKDNPVAQRSYEEYNPINYVQNWDTPLLIIQGEKDYRVATEQGLGAFQAAQLRGIKSKLLYFADEGHWVLKPQNGLVWQREFFKWLKETL